MSLWDWFLRPIGEFFGNVALFLLVMAGLLFVVFIASLLDKGKK